ncbi:RidA family protein [Shimia abyssi]|uniref:Enamine deaminase RidA (YjgF/YER057c/UK114 family) n=1 Tax=Shimia abyssi TaxID=1662395 RepID=A0A2P8FBR4_9RHOB|nr:RidA family protein [Shimia abyssi]PSL19149.1 enamine deaminase RidA (YjgF/YER057c/UK114 family) [Shimia abyssi]
MRPLNPDAIAPPFGRYSHGVEIAPGQRVVRTSGQLALAQDGSVPNGARAQADLCFDNIRHIIAEAGMTPQDVVHVSGYVTDRDYFPDYMAARDAFLEDVDLLPSSTLLIVSGFTRPEFLVEVEVWAAAP